MKQVDAWRQLHTGREHGFPVCNCDGELVQGETRIGHATGVTVVTRCERGRPVAIFHTHPGATSAVPSPADVRSAWDEKLPVCIGLPDTGEVRCFKATGPTRYKWLG